MDTTYDITQLEGNAFQNAFRWYWENPDTSGLNDAQQLEWQEGSSAVDGTLDGMGARVSIDEYGARVSVSDDFLEMAFGIRENLLDGTFSENGGLLEIPHPTDTGYYISIDGCAFWDSNCVAALEAIRKGINAKITELGLGDIHDTDNLSEDMWDAIDDLDSEVYDTLACDYQECVQKMCDAMVSEISEAAEYWDSEEGCRQALESRALFDADGKFVDWA